MEHFIGRSRECGEVAAAMRSARSEFVVLCGRRRVGKTFLVRSFFRGQYDFHYVGAHRSGARFQLRAFRLELEKYSGTSIPNEFVDWMDAFRHLETYLEGLSLERKKVVFLDEMPWIDTKHSDFVEALEYFWNSWVSERDDIVLIACGSATSWMADKLADNQGGLHNRITRQVYLRPFTLHECEEFLVDRGFDWDRYQIIQCYMIFGGVPFYWSLLDNRLSLAQNVDKLCFQEDGLLRREYDELYSALFNKADRYIAVVEALSNHHEGLFRDEICAATGIGGGGLTMILQNLERCDFITSYAFFGKRSKSALYRLTDFFTLFYLRFMHGVRGIDEEFWSHHFLKSDFSAWQGLTFEVVCLRHLAQIRKALGISGIETRVSSWRYVPNKSTAEGAPTQGAQVDLVISRIDKVVHLCEIKFSQNPFVITKDYAERLKLRAEIFRQATKTSHGVVQTFITPQGLAEGIHRSLVHSEVTAKDLFAE